MIKDVGSVVRRLAEGGLSTKEIALYLGYSREDIDINYGVEFASGHVVLVESLRRMQLEKARGGNVPMLIHLGKYYLNQHELALRDDVDVDKVLHEASTSDLLKLVKLGK